MLTNTILSKWTSSIFEASSKLQITIHISLFAALIALSYGSRSFADTTVPHWTEGQQTDANSSAGNIVVLGDSLAYGYGANDESVRPSGCLSSLPHNQVFNIAVNGSTSREILNSSQNIQTYSPRLIFVSSGGNDVLRELKGPGSYPKTKTLAELRELFTLLKSTGAVVVYLGLNPPAQGTERLVEASQLANSLGLVVVDGMKDLWLDQKYMHDSIHPNNEGYKILCERTLNAIRAYYP